MARIHRLTAREVETAPVGWHGDGGCLHLRVRESGVRSWVFRYVQGGRVREIGLGPTHARSLKEARALAAQMRKAILEGRDPALVVRPERPPPAKTFAEIARELIAMRRAGWRSRKHAAQWSATLTQYAYPRIGGKPPADVTLEDVLACLKPIWATKPETASRLRQRIEAVLDYAKVIGLRSGDNPARWRGALDKLLPPPNKVKLPKHHAALPYERMPEFMAALREREGIAARCLEFAILTAARSGEARKATWREVDLESRTWTIPAERMKAKREHRVPLSDAAVRLLETLPRFAGNDLVFPAARGGALHDQALAGVIARMQGDPPRWTDRNGVPIVPHGFRACFRVWCEEVARAPQSVSEAALAHVNADKVESAYLRSDLFALRVELMRRWGEYCTRPTAGNVVLMTRARAER
jgi:integrase